MMAFSTCCACVGLYAITTGVTPMSVKLGMHEGVAEEVMTKNERQDAES